MLSFFMHSEKEKIFKHISAKPWKNDLYTTWELIKPHIGRLLLAILAGILLSAIDGAIAYLIKPVLDSLFQKQNQAVLYLLPAGIFLLFVMRGFFSFSNNFLMASIGSKMLATLRQLFYEKLLKLPMRFYQDKSSSTVVSRLLNDIGSLEHSIAFIAKNFFVNIFTIVALASIALYRRWDLALLSFLVIPAVVIVSDRFGRRMKRTSQKTRKLISRFTKVVHETLTGMKIIKAFTMEGSMQKRGKEAVWEHYRNVMREVRIQEFTGAVMEVIAGLGIAIILYYGSFLILKGKMTVGEFFSFIAAVLMMYTPLKRLSRINNHFQTIRAVFDRLREVLQFDDEPQGGFCPKQIKGHIVITNLTFQYPSTSEPALYNVNLEIHPGETVAIVGFSGAGKSTLSDILLGFWNDYSGEILIDGIELRQYHKACLRAFIGIVTQDIVLFDDTIKNNILFGKPDATEQEVLEAAKAAYVEEFVARLPKGYDTFIGERGHRLSGGQRQRIALARAILKNPRILILDEATSSLDADSEAKVQKSLERFIPGRTTIIIAHRLSTIQFADRIIVLERGRVVQTGTHEELFQQEGPYRDLYLSQLNFSSRVH